MVGDEDHDGADGDAVEGNAIERERELSDGDDHGDCGNHDVQRLVEVDLVLNPNTDADHADHAVQQGGHATEHASRNRVDDGTELRTQAQQQCETSRAPVGCGGIHLGGCHHTNVLTVRGGAGTAAETGDGGAKTVGEQGGADLVVIIAAGHLGNGLDVADVFGNEHEHHRNEHRQNREINLRQVESRQTNPSSLADGGEVNLATNASVCVTDDHTDQNVESAKQTLEQHCYQQHGSQSHDSGIGSDLEVVPHARSQIETDDGHDCTVDHRRHDDVNPLGAREVHEHTDQSQQQTGDENAEGCDGNALVRRGDGGDRGDEAEGRTQVARQHVLVDQQEQCGRHGREEQGGGRVETGQNRHEERGSEHGDDMLCADFGGARPRQALVRLNDFARLQRLAVTVDLPREQIGHAIVSLTLLRGKQKRAACHSHCSGAWTRARCARKMGASIVDISQSDHAINRPTHITGDGQPHEQRPPNRHSTALDA